MKFRTYILSVIMVMTGMTQVFAQSGGTTGTDIFIDGVSCTTLYSDLPSGNAGKYFQYLRHNQVPVQILNANPMGGAGYAALLTAPGTGTGFFAPTHMANNMVFADNQLEFYNYRTNYDGQCFAIIAPKGYRFTQYYMDIRSTQYSNPASANSGAPNAVIERYTYNEGSTYNATTCSGESMTLTGTNSQVFNHSLGSGSNILYFKITYTDKNTQWCVHMNELRLTYVMDNAVEEIIPNSDGTSVHTGIVNLGELTDHSADGKYFFRKANVTDLENVNIIADDPNANITVKDGYIQVGNGTYYIESPKNYRITGATVNFEAREAGEATYTALNSINNLVSGEKYLISAVYNNSRYYLTKNPSSNGFSSGITVQDGATKWTIIQLSTGGYTIFSEDDNRYLAYNNGLTTIAANDYNATYCVWQYSTTYSCFYNNTSYFGRSYYLRYNGSWTGNRNSPSSLTLYSVNYPDASPFTGTVYSPDGSTEEGSASLTTDNAGSKASVKVSNYNNDAIRFQVSGLQTGCTASFTVNLTFAPLDPFITNIEVGYLPNGSSTAINKVPVSVTDFKFNNGNTIVVPIPNTAPESTYQLVFRNADNENKSSWYGTPSGNGLSYFYLPGSPFELSGATSPAPDSKVNTDQAGTVELKTSNIETLTNTGGWLTEYEFNKSSARYEDIKLANNATKTVYVYSIDKPLHNILPASKRTNSHEEWAYYKAIVQPSKVIEEPVIEVTPIYTSTLKVKNVKGGIADDNDLDETHTFYGVKVTSRVVSGSGTAEGYLPLNQIVEAIQAEMEKDTYSATTYSGDPLRTILYVDMSALTSVSSSDEDDSFTTLQNATADNCLFFMPSGFSYSMNNMVAGGEGGLAVSDITIYDQQPFYTPFSFRTGTRKVHYERKITAPADHGLTTVAQATIIMPFNISLDPNGHFKPASDQVDDNLTFYTINSIGEEYTDEEKRQLDIYGKAYKLVATPVSTGIARANTPYHVTSSEKTDVTSFVVEATGVNFVKTDSPTAMTTTTGTMTGYGNFNGVRKDKTDNILYYSKEYFWNSSTLQKSNTVKIAPFRVYYTTTESVDANMYGLWFLDDSVLNSVTAPAVKNPLDFSVTDGSVNVVTNNDVDIRIHDISGRLVVTDHVSAGSSRSYNLAPGIYIIGGKKVIVK
jgi:hypothetical protein